MKKIALYVLLVLGAVSISSCTDKFLNVDYYSIVNPDGVYEDADNVFGGLMGIYNALYVDDYNGVWPHPVLAGYPALDMQAEGWDAEISTHSWGVDSKSGFFENLWKPSYKLISRCNIYLNDLANTVSDETVTPAQKKIYEAEARALRAYTYYILTVNFSRVPMLMTGETYANSPEKARPDSDDEAWAAIKEDLEFAAEVLDWKSPDGMTGRFTKAAALAFAAKTNMYLGDYALAKSQFEKIINESGKSLNPVHGMIHWLDNEDSQETIWEVSFPEFPSMGWSIGSYAKNGDKHFCSQQNKPTQFGGWGDSPVSYEYTRCFEPGDKRLMYNVAGWHAEKDGVAAYGDTNPYTNQTIGSSAMYAEIFESAHSNLPNNHCMKYWKTNEVYSARSVQIFRFTEALIGYAECCFRTNEPEKGWAALDKVRDRAFGNLEVGFDPNSVLKSGTKHPFPSEILNTEKVSVTPAKEYYHQYANTPVFQGAKNVSPTWASKGVEDWEVALIQERRKEFLQEHSFWYDLTRMNRVAEWLDVEYPKNDGATFYNVETGDYYIPTGTNKNQPYVDASPELQAKMIPVTDRAWDWNKIHLVYPIPTSELTANKACTQNDGY